MGLPWKRAATQDCPSTNSHRMECTHPLWFDWSWTGPRRRERAPRAEAARSAEEEHDNDAVRTFVGDWVR